MPVTNNRPMFVGDPPCRLNCLEKVRSRRNTNEGGSTNEGGDCEGQAQVPVDFRVSQDWIGGAPLKDYRQTL
jgi:hypothetical protein